MHIFNELKKSIQTILSSAARLLKPKKTEESKGLRLKRIPDKKTAVFIGAVSVVLVLIIVFAIFKKRRKARSFSRRESVPESISSPFDDYEADICRTPDASVKPRKRNAALFSVLAVALAGCALLLAFKSADYFSQMRKTAAISETVRVVTGDTAAPSQSYSPPLVSPAAAAESPEAAPSSYESFKEEAEPEPEPPKEFLEAITKLREVFSNDDIVALLKIKGTNIEYAVAQSSDNEYYLNRDLYGAINSAGSIFMDYECDPLSLSRNTVIYGHNMRNGTMFHNIRYYAQKEFYDNNRFIQLTTPYEETVWEIFSFYQTDTSFYYIQVLFKNDEEFMRLVSQMKEKSIYETGVTVDKNDKVLTLSTCANTPDDARLVINAKLVSSSSINNFKNL